jgi:hypothetical protein
MKKNKTMIASGVLAAAVAQVSFGQTPVPLWEPFGYSSGALHAQNGWATTAGGTGLIQVDSTKNLTYNSQLPSKPGLAVLATDITGGEKLGVPTMNSAGDVGYFAFNMRVTDISVLLAASTGAFFAGFNGDRLGTGLTTGSAWIRVRRDPLDTTKWQLGVQRQGNLNTAITWDTNSFAVDSLDENKRFPPPR